MKIIFACGLLTTLLSFPVNADSFLRIKCESTDIGAEVYVNDALVGNCPVDAPAPAGAVSVRVHKLVDNDHEQIFIKQIKVIDGVPQRIDVLMPPPQLTADAIRRNEEAEAAAQLQAAEGGNIPAMRKIADYFDTGMGVEKNSEKAAEWRNKAEAAVVAKREAEEQAYAQSQLRAANAGNVDAMDNIAGLYESGRGIEKNISQAETWRTKATGIRRETAEREEAAKLAAIAKEKARIKQAKIDDISFLGATKYNFDRKNYVLGANDSLVMSVALTWSPVSLVIDLVAAPTRSTELYKIKHEASLRPSTWGKPDSMIARASIQMNSNNIQY